MSFWERLYDICVKKGCKPNTVAKAIGLSTATATKWKNGTIPNGEALAKIADYLGCSIDYLLGRSDHPDRQAAQLTDSDLKFALFGGEKGITDAQLDEVKKFAAFIKERDKDKK